MILEVLKDPKRFGMELGIKVGDNYKVETLLDIVRTEELRRFVRENNLNSLD
jgi:hypothetical protein